MQISRSARKISLIIICLIGCQSLVPHHKIDKDTPRNQKAYVIGLSEVRIISLDEDSYQHLDTVFVSPENHSYAVKLKTNWKKGSIAKFKYAAHGNSTTVICPEINTAQKTWKPFLLFNESNVSMYSLTLCENYIFMVGSPWIRKEVEEVEFYPR